MKKTKIISLVLLTLGLVAQAQNTDGFSHENNTKAFRFVSKLDSNAGQKGILNHDLDNSKATTVAMTREKEIFTNRDGFLDAFIVKRTEIGKVLISAVKNSNLFLSYTDDGIAFAEVDPTDQHKVWATWNLSYAGPEGYVIIRPTNPTYALAFNVADGSISYEEMVDENGNALNGSAKVAAKFIFSTDTINNLL